MPAAINTSAHTTPKLLILADGLLGAADCAVAGVWAGLRSVVMLRAGVGHPIGYPTSADVLALDTDTQRANATDTAATQVAAWHALAWPAVRLYKKIDSTLRGSIAAEVAALAPLMGLAIVAPASPAVGRTAHDGRQWLHDMAVEDTEVWRSESISGRVDLRVILEYQDLQTAVLMFDDIRTGAATLAGRLAALQANGV